MSDETAPIFFSESFQLQDRQGVVHTFQLSGNLTQKGEIFRKSSESINKALAGGWTSVQTTPVTPTAPVASDPNTTTETVMGETLEVTHDKKGKHFNVKGGKYTKFGLPIYPEYLDELGVKGNMEPGEYPFKKKILVQCTKNGDKTNCKVIALA
jgi:hypothetical protein